MTYRAVILSTMLAGAVVAVAAEDPAWVGELGACLNRLDEASGRAEIRALVGSASDLVESVRDDTRAGTAAEAARYRGVLERAAAKRVLPAAMLLGETCRAAGEAEEAFTWFRQAATQGYPPAMIQVGLMYSNGDGVERDLEKASSWLRPANVKGSAVGKYLLAECFLYGKGVERNPETAVALLREAADLPHPGRALDLLATCYHKGWGVDRDSGKAAELYEQACDEGFRNGCANLAVLTMTGDGVVRDPEAAVAMLRDGVEHENAMCMFFYGAALLDGLGGLEANEAEAIRWLRRAARAGNEPAAAWCRQHGVGLDGP